MKAFTHCCRLLITFANSLDPDQAIQNVPSDLDPCCLTLIVFLKEFFEYIDFENKMQTTKKHAKSPGRQRMKMVLCALHKDLQAILLFPSIAGCMHVCLLYSSHVQNVINSGKASLC